MRLNSGEDMPPAGPYDRDYFKSHKKLYLEKNSVFWQRFNLISKYLRPGAEDVVLECGCGIGTTALELARRSKKVVAVDNSPLAVQLAKGFVKETTPRLKNLEIVRADLTNLPFKEDTFDKVCFSEIVEHLESPEAVLKEVRRVLKKGGTVFVSTWPNIGNIFWSLRYKLGLGSRADFNPQSAASLKTLLASSGLEAEFLKAYDFYIPGLIPVLIVLFKRGEKLDKIVKSLERRFTRGVLAPYFSAAVLALARK